MRIWKRNINLKNINNNMKNTLASHLGINITLIEDNLLEGEMLVRDFFKTTLWYSSWRSFCSVGRNIRKFSI